MEPILNRTSPLVFVRPIPAEQPLPSALERRGQVFQGTVLRQTGEGRYEVDLGGRRLLVESRAPLEVGRTLVFRVAQGGSGSLLSVLGEAGGERSPLLAALGSRLGAERPLGQLLTGLAAALRGVLPGASSAERPALESLLTRLESHAFRPGTDGPGLKALLGSVGLSYEARLSGAAAPDPTAASQALLAALGREFIPLLRDLPPGSVREALERCASQLRALAAQPLPSAGTGQPAAELARLASGLLAMDGGGGTEPTRAELTGLLGALDRLLGRGAGQGGGLVALLAAAGADTEALVRSALAAARGDPLALRALTGDLKAQLLAALGELADGPAREAVARVLAGLEVEQLLNLARRAGGEPLHWSLPFPDGAGWSTAHLLVHGRDERGHAEDGEPGPAGERFTLALELASLGAVRADLCLSPSDLYVRLLAARPEVAERFARDAEQLSGRLAFGSRRVHLSAGRGEATELDLERSARDVRYLRDHHVMDLEG